MEGCLMTVADQTLKKGLSISEKLKIIIVLAVPAVIENFFQTMLGFADTFFVAQIGLDEVSAVGVTNAILAIYFAIFMAIGVGVNVLMANATGAGDYEIGRASCRERGECWWVGVRVMI